LNGPDAGYVPYIAYVAVHHVSHHPVQQTAERQTGPRSAHDIPKIALVLAVISLAATLALLAYAGLPT
jgi:hypothetical protein